MRMETGTFLQGNVQEYINRFFSPLKYESGKDAEQFLRFSIKGTPTYIILDSNGDEISRVTGFNKGDDFIRELDTARSKSG